MTKMFMTPLEDPNQLQQDGIVINQEEENGHAVELGMWEEVKEEEQFDVIHRARDTPDEEPN